MVKQIIALSMQNLPQANIKNEIFAKRKVLRKDGQRQLYYVNQNLTPFRRKLFVEVKKLQNVKFKWVNKIGEILIKSHERSIVRAINGQYKGNLQVGYIWNFIAYISYMVLWDLKFVCCHLNFLEQFFWQPIQKN